MTVLSPKLPRVLKVPRLGDFKNKYLILLKSTRWLLQVEVIVFSVEVPIFPSSALICEGACFPKLPTKAMFTSLSVSSLTYFGDPFTLESGIMLMVSVTGFQ